MEMEAAPLPVGQAGGLKKASNFIFKMALYMFSIIYKCTQRRKSRDTRARLQQT